MQPASPATASGPANLGAQLLRAWRDAQSPRVTQFALSIKTGIEPQSISSYERGASLPSRRHAVTLHDVTGVPVGAWDLPPQADHLTSTQHGGTP